MGYKVHLTETCEDEGPHLITHVATTTAPISGGATTTPIHRALERKSLLPRLHIVDTGYTDAALIVESRRARGLRSRLAVYAATATQPTYTETFAYRGDRVGAVAVDGAHPFVETFVYRPDGTPLELLYREPSEATQRYWYVVDGQGSVIAVTDASGQVVNQYAYDPWGAGYNASYPEEATQETVLQPLRYRGYWDDAWYGGDTSGAVQGALARGAHLARVRAALRATLSPAAPLTYVKAPARPGTLSDLPSALAPQTSTDAIPTTPRLTMPGQRGTSARASATQAMAGGSAASDQGPLPWYWLTARYYDPTLRRFLQPDPSALDGVRSYVYCHNDPADCADPTGLAGGLLGEGGEVPPVQMRFDEQGQIVMPDEVLGAPQADGAGGGTSGTSDVTAEIIYEHEISADQGTYLRDLADQIQGQINGFNRDLADGGVQGLQDKITNYQQNKVDIDRTGRSFARKFTRAFNKARVFPRDAAIVDDVTGQGLSPLHEQDMALGGDPKGVTRLGFSRNDFIIGGQADDISNQIFAADDSATRFTWKLIVRGLGRGGTRVYLEGDNMQDIPAFLERP